MKKQLVAISMALLCAGAAKASSFFFDPVLIHQAMLQMDSKNAINWQVGDFQDIALESLFGPGTGHKEVTKEEPAQNAVWMVSNISLGGQEQKVEALIDRADGHTIKLIVNGQEQSPGGGGNIEIEEQYETTIDVPAGHFDCMYVKAKVNGQQPAELQAWVNPIAIVIDGAAKEIIKQGFMTITLTLQKFGHAH